MSVQRECQHHYKFYSRKIQQNAYRADLFFPMMQAFYETGLYEEKTNDGIDNGATVSG